MTDTTRVEAIGDVRCGDDLNDDGFDLSALLMDRFGQIHGKENISANALRVERTLQRIIEADPLTAVAQQMREALIEGWRVSKGNGYENTAMKINEAIAQYDALVRNETQTMTDKAACAQSVTDKKERHDGR